jgi:plasmid maintenance system antidote protein VapI
MEEKRWHLERRVSVSVLVQLVTLAGLIVGTWVNLQRQLDLVSHDVKQLLAAQEKFCDKVDVLQEKTIAQEYRLQQVEREK